MIDDIPRADTHTVATNTKHNNSSFGTNYGGSGGIHAHKIDYKKFHYVESVPARNLQNKNFAYDDSPKSRVDVYYFDHGNAA